MVNTLSYITYSRAVCVTYNQTVRSQNSFLNKICLSCLVNFAVKHCTNFIILTRVCLRSPACPYSSEKHLNTWLKFVNIGKKIIALETILFCFLITYESNVAVRISEVGETVTDVQIQSSQKLYRSCLIYMALNKLSPSNSNSV